MEQNQFEGLEEIEQVEKVKSDEKELKEYEKLLLAENDREATEKAKNLVEFGCFSQEEVTTIDFNDYIYIKQAKKFKGRYELYQNKETLALVFVCPLVENNKGDVDENRAMKPYAYDCLFVEQMDEETYKAVCHAAKNNIRTKISVLYKTSFITFFVLIAITLFNFVYNLITASGDFFGVVNSAIYYSAPLIIGVFIMIPLLVLISIKYKKYKDQQ